MNFVVTGITLPQRRLMTETCEILCFAVSPTVRSAAPRCIAGSGWRCR
jgi:hypothetical protein